MTTQRRRALLTVAEVAEHLGVSQVYVRREIQRKHLRATSLRGKAGYRVDEADLETYVNANANVSQVRRPT